VLWKGTFDLEVNLLYINYCTDYIHGLLNTHIHKFTVNIYSIQGVSQLLKQSDWAQIQDFK